MSPQRTIAFWFDHWPITARSLTSSAPFNADAAMAVVRANTVIACSPAASAAGVRAGQRRRDAQAACAELELFSDEPDRDERAFSPVVSLIEELAPGVQIFRPGLCVLRARGPARYYGGELEAACVMLDAIRSHGITTARVGIADGPFAAEHAARTARPIEPSAHRIRIIAPHETPAFLAPLPVAVLDDPDIVSLLSRLGVHTLGAFAALDEDLVRDRLSERGVRLYALAAGHDARAISARTPPPDLVREIAFEPALDVADHIAFAVRQTVDDFIASLSAVSLVCTEVRIEFTDDAGHLSDRVWLNPTFFTAAAIVDRVRWQLQAAAANTAQRAVAKVRFVPEAVDAAAHHQPSLLGRATDTRVHHVASRVQALLGHQGVVTAEVVGGRLLSERQLLVPWGDRIVAPSVRERPWPGHLDSPLPTTLFGEAGALEVIANDATPLTVNDRGTLNAVPSSLVSAGQRRRIVSWAGPWPLKERFWADAVVRYRFQFVDEHAVAWVLLYADGAWRAEGRYD